MKVGDLVRWNATFTSWTDARGVGIVIKVGRRMKFFQSQLEVVNESR